MSMIIVIIMMDRVEMIFDCCHDKTDRVEMFTAERHGKRADLGTREIPFSGSVFIDQDDFFDTGVDGLTPPPKGYKRLLLGGQVRLKYAYVITCDSVVRDEKGQVVEVVCSYDENTRAGVTPEGAKKVRTKHEQYVRK